MSEIVVGETNEVVDTFCHRWMQSFNTGDIDGLMDLYTEDAINIPWTGPIQKGKQEIRTGIEFLYGDGGGAARPTTDITVLKVEDCGERQIAVGLFKGNNDKGEKVTGNWISVYKTEQGTWKICYHASNTNE